MSTVMVMRPESWTVHLVSITLVSMAMMLASDVQPLILVRITCIINLSTYHTLLFLSITIKSMLLVAIYFGFTKILLVQAVLLVMSDSLEMGDLHPKEE